jgi:hypothetical protein
VENHANNALSHANIDVSIQNAERNVLRFVIEDHAKNLAKLYLSVDINVSDYVVKNVQELAEINFVKTTIIKHLRFYLEMNKMMMPIL